MSAVAPKVFDTAFSRYERIRQIGNGGCGTVVEAADPEGVIYAVKYLSPGTVTTEKAKRFKNEIAFCERNTHPCVISVLDRGSVDVGGSPTPFYVMRHYAGSLRTLMRQGIEAAGVLPLFAQVLDGLEAAHLQGVFHRDMKPENILHDGTSGLVVADFGIAQFREADMATTVETAHSSRLANFQYAAPEQRVTGGSADQRADIYALGLILNEMFTGRVPHGTGYATIASVSSAHGYLDELVERMIAQDPSHRPQTVAEVKRALIARGESVVREQKLSELKQTVIPAEEADDPLIDCPPEIVEVKWEDGGLLFTLSQPVNHEWISHFQNPSSYTWVQGYGPEQFRFSGNTAFVNKVDNGNLAQQVVNNAKTYVQKANVAYKGTIEARAHAVQRKKEAELRARIQQEEKAREINSSLRL